MRPKNDISSTEYQSLLLPIQHIDCHSDSWGPSGVKIAEADWKRFEHVWSHLIQ